MACFKWKTDDSNLFSDQDLAHSQAGIIPGVRWEILICFFLLVATFIPYWQMGGHDFIVFDDNLYVSENPHVKAGLTLKSITWAFTAGHAANWHPLTWLSHMLDSQIYGINPGKHHLSNLFFHMANTLLWFLVLKQMTGALWKSGFVAALFALHPLHVESVAWLSERKDVLSTFFWILTLWAYLRYTRYPKIRHYFLVCLFLSLGLMSKPMLVTLPCVLILLDYWPLGNLRFGKFFFSDKRQAAKIPLFILAIVSACVTFFVQQKAGAMDTGEAYPLSVKIGNALVSYTRYLEKTFWPSDLAFLYPHPGMLPWWQIAGAAALLISISVLVIRHMRECPYLPVGWFWYLGTLAPVIGVIQVGTQAMADRYTYVPLIGIFIMIAWGIPDLLKRFPYKKTLLTAVGSVIILILGSLTWAQVRYWQDSVTLFEHALAVTENNYVAYHNLGVALQDQGKPAKAIEYYFRALQIKPDYTGTYNNMGTAFEGLGKLKAAVFYYAKSLQIRPDLSKTHNNMGMILEKLGQTDQAILHYTEALRLKPNYSEVHKNWGNLLLRRGNTDQAIEHYQAILRIQPDNAGAYNNLGIALFRKGKVNEAVAQFQKALQINPGHTEACGNLKKLGIRQ